MDNVRSSKLQWNNAKKNIINYFDKNNVRVVTDEYIGRAYDNETGKLLCECYLDDEDIINKVLEIKPHLKTKELKELEKKLNKTYNNYIKASIKEDGKENIA